MELIPSFSMLTAFVLASFILAITPGPAVLYIVTRSIAQGRSSGLASVAGVALGNLGNMIGASVGLAAVFAVSTVAFLVVKYLGAAYLIFIGVQMIFDAKRTTPEFNSLEVKPTPILKIFRDGFLVALFNPKTTLFFAAFLPQFLDAHDQHLIQSLVLGSIFVMIAACTDIMYVFAASFVRSSLGSTKLAAKTGKNLSGISFIGLGLLTAFSSHKAQ